jgi:outer membrane protein TolC
MFSEINTVYLQKLIDTAKVYYPKYKTYDHRIKIADDNIKKTKVSWFDVLTFSLSYSPTNATSSATPTLNGYQAGLFFNVGNLLVKPHNITQAKEELAIAELNKKEYILSIEAEVKTRYYKYIQELTILKLQKQKLLDRDILVTQSKHRFERGEETLENYTKAMSSYSDQKQVIFEVEGALLIAKSNLEEIVGKKLEEIN